jgi:hypothetical protein
VPARQLHQVYDRVKPPASGHARRAQVLPVELQPVVAQAPGEPYATRQRQRILGEHRPRIHGRGADASQLDGAVLARRGVEGIHGVTGRGGHLAAEAARALEVER